DEKQQKWTALSGGKKNDQNRPDDVGSMHQQAKRSGGLLAKAQQQHDHDAVDDVEAENPESPAGVAEFGRIHPDGHQGGYGQKDARRGQIALDAAHFARNDWGSQPATHPVFGGLRGYTDHRTPVVSV